MTPPLSDRLKDVQRQYVEMDHHLASIQNAARAAEHNYRTLTDKCREEVHLRQQVIEGLKYERTMLLCMAVLAGAFGAFGAGLMSEAARWLWQSILATVGGG